MLQIVTKHYELLRLIYKIPIVKFFFAADITQMNRSIDPKFEAMAYRLFYTSNGTTKQTADQRFKSLDPFILKYFDKDTVHVIHDIAVSSGVTSLNLFDLLVEHTIGFELFISDKFSKVEYSKGFIRRVFDQSGKLILAYVGPFVATDKIRPFFISRFLYRAVSKWHYHGLLNSLYLYNSSVLKLIDEGKIKNIEYDLFEPSHPQSFTFVRCMNVLNLNYFGEAKIEEALKNIFQTLKDDGILLIGRTTQEGVNHASFYKKQNNKFHLLETVNGGSETNAIVLNTKYI